MPRAKKSAATPDETPVTPAPITPTVASTATDVKTKVVSKTSLAIATAFLGAAAIAAGLVSLPSTDPMYGYNNNTCWDSDYTVKNDAGMPLFRYSFVNFGTKGTAYGIKTNSNEYVAGTDECSTDGKRVLEFFCDIKANKVTWNGYACPSGTSCVDGACVKPQPVYDATLEVALSSDKKSQILVPGAVGGELSKITLATYKFSAKDNNVQVKSIRLNPVVTDPNFTSIKDYDSIYLADENGDIANANGVPTGSGEMVFQLDNFVVNAGSSSTLYVKAVLQPLQPFGGGTSGHVVGYKVANPVEAISLSSNNSAKVNYTEEGVYHFIHKGKPSSSGASSSWATSLTNGTKNLFSLGLSAIGGDVSLYKLSFKLETSNVSVSNLEFYEKQGGIELFVGKLVPGGEPGVWTTSGEEWGDYAPITKEITIGKNQTRQFVLKGNVTGAVTGSVVSTKLLSDESVSWNKPFSSAGSLSNYNFVWSDRTDAAHSVNSADWTNGVAVYLPSGFQTLAK